MLPPGTTVGFIGTGCMGRPMIHKLLQADFIVQVYDLHKTAADEVVEAGAIWRDTPRLCAQGMDIVCTCLPLPEHVLENMVGDDGGLAGMEKGSVWVDCSTTDYHNTLHIAGLAKEKGVYSIEAPVSNLSHMGVDFCNMSYFAAGDEEGYQILKDFLAITGKIDFYVGKIGMAQSAKLLTNDMFYTGVVTFGECTALLQEAGVPLYWWWEFVKKSKGNSVASDQFSVFLFDGSWDDSCTLEIGIKDMSLTVAMSKEVGEYLPVTEATNDAYAASSSRYDIYTGHVQVIRLTEDDNNLQLRIPDFSAPSKYGVNKAYKHPEGFISDSYGRTRPPLPESYKAPNFDPSNAQLELAETLCEYLALVNEAIYDESIRLGIGMGLEKDLIIRIIRWSVGTCWVSDHLEELVRDETVLDKMASHVGGSSLTLRNYPKVDRALRERFAHLKVSA